MACDLASGRVVDCKSSIGGISKVFIGNYQDMVNNSTWTETLDVVSAIVAQDFYSFAVRPETSSLTVNYQSDPASGTTYFEQNLSLTFQLLDSTDIADIRVMCQGRPNIWVLDNMDNCWLIGAEFGCNVTAGNLVTGAAFGDLSGYTVDFSGRESNPVWIAAAGAVGTPLSGVTGATIV
tara:strand:+ start:464 stop:1000 length:537 start_codon:yes stop_codon:yes gene_type:complete